MRPSSTTTSIHFPSKRQTCHGASRTGIARLFELQSVSKKNDRFDATASGLRWGATTYNPRFDNLGPAPIGFAWELAVDSNIGRTPPQAISANYFQSI